MSLHFRSSENQKNFIVQMGRKGKVKWQNVCAIYNEIRVSVLSRAFMSGASPLGSACVPLGY